jgi:GTP-binding protein
LLVDELNLTVRGGAGGAGLSHFARRKYQPFGGPDGGDGGAGGNVLLSGRRDLDDLAALRTVNASASPGGPGGPNLKSGVLGRDYELLVPLGTLAYDADSGAELGYVCSTVQRPRLARGGQGGRGNPHFATAQIRAPKKSQPGEPGEERQIILRYRIYADTMLVEPPVLSELTLVPVLLQRDPAAVDYALYCRKPRWIRCEHEYSLYDIAFLPLEAASNGMAAIPFLEHLYWAQHIIINLLPLGELQLEAHAATRRLLTSATLRRADRVVFVGSEVLAENWALETETGRVEIEYAAAAELAELAQLFLGQLCGTIVS